MQFKYTFLEGFGENAKILSASFSIFLCFEREKYLTFVVIFVFLCSSATFSINYNSLHDLQKTKLLLLQLATAL